MRIKMRKMKKSDGMEEERWKKYNKEEENNTDRE